jgi:PAS domain S-box-containing protein
MTLSLKLVDSSKSRERDLGVEFLNNAQLMVLLLDAGGCIEQVSPYFEEITERRLDEIKGWDWFSTFLPESHQEAMRALFMKSVGDAPVRAKVSPVLTRSGEERVIEWNAQIIKVADGQLAGVLAIGQDVTDRSKMEQEVRLSAFRLNEAQRIAHVGSWELDLVTGALFWTDEIFKLFEIDKTCFGATYEAFLNAIHPDDRDAVNHAYTSSLVNQKPYVIVHRLLMPDGRVKYVEERCQSDFDAQGKALRSVGTVQDITAQYMADEAIRRLNAELEDRVVERTAQLQKANQELVASLEQLRRAQAQLVESKKMAALGALVAGVAHEINTPIGIGVTAASHLLEKIEALASRYQSGVISRGDLTNFVEVASESSTMVLANLQRASELIRSFKQVAVDQVGGASRSFFLKDYLAEVLRSLSPELDRTRHQVRLSCPPDLEIHGRAGDYSQIMTNLVMNSLIHGFEGVQAGHIEIDVSVQAGQLTLRYGDDGKGIEPQNLPKIFDPFFTTKRGQGGSGLGLHLVYNIVTQGLGGVIRCVSTPSRGVVFDICVPLTHEQVQDGMETVQAIF